MQQRTALRCAAAIEGRAPHVQPSRARAPHLFKLVKVAGWLGPLVHVVMVRAIAYIVAALVHVLLARARRVVAAWRRASGELLVHRPRPLS